MPSGFEPTQELRDHFRRKRVDGDDHPSPEQLVAFHEDRLSPDELESVREHVAACPDCTAQLLALAELAGDGEEAGADVSKAELDAAWNRQWERLSASSAPIPFRRRISSFRMAWVMGVAAALLAVVSVRQGLDLARLRRPQLNPPLVSLEPVGSRRASAAAELLLPADAERAWVILNPDPETRLDDSFYDIHLVTSDGSVLHKFEDVPKSEKSNFRLGVPKSLLQEGIYRFIVVTQERMHIVEQFQLSVRPSPPSSP